jgi:hypothetical protein
VCYIYKNQIGGWDETAAETYVFRRCETIYAEGKAVSWASDAMIFMTYCAKLTWALKTLVTADALGPSQENRVSVGWTYLVRPSVALGTAG